MFLSVDNTVAALKDWLSGELCRKAGSKQLKRLILRLADIDPFQLIVAGAFLTATVGFAFFFFPLLL